MRRIAAIFISLILLCTTVSAVAADASSASQPAQPKADCNYYSETQHNLCAGFRAYWEKYGGLAIFGFPITEEYVDNGMTVQYFERARFEWHPGEWPERYDVELGLLGDTYASNLGLTGTAPFQSHGNANGCASYAGGTNDCVYFAVTGHSVSGKFLDYWNAHGGLAIFGYPISDQYTENGRTVQYFERERMELHPEFAGTPYEVLLGLLGAKILNGPMLEVMAGGLNNPRGVAAASDGTVYVAEAGSGGTGQCIDDPEGGTTCFGTSGAITKVANGTQSQIVTGLPSLADEQGMSATGPADVSVGSDGSVSAIIQGVGTPDARTGLGDDAAILGHLIQITGQDQYDDIADLMAYEAANNPDGGEIDSDPYSVLALSDKWIVTDAAGNDLLQVDADGNISTLAVFPDQMVDNPEGGDQIPAQSVPTTVALGPDGAYYVGELTGFPFPVGKARIWRVVPGEEPTVYADGFTNIIALDFDSNGNLWVLEITKNGLLAAQSATPEDPSAATGALIRVNSDGSRTEIASNGLITPAGLAIGPNGEIYVSNFGIFTGAGELVRVDY